MFSKILTRKSTETYSDKIERLKEAPVHADTVVIGAGAGLFISAGFTCTVERFEKNFGDLKERHGIRDIAQYYEYLTGIRIGK